MEHKLLILVPDTIVYFRGIVLNDNKLVQRVFIKIQVRNKTVQMPEVRLESDPNIFSPVWWWWW